MLKGLKKKAERSVKGVANTVATLTSSPPGEMRGTGTPGLLVRAVWGKSDALMKVMLRSMTPPIHVDNKNADHFIQDCIEGIVEERLTEDDVWKGDLVQLYCLSYRHESKEKPKRMSKMRLKKVVDSIRSHVTEMNNHYYSVWIDSLFADKQLDPDFEWADRGLPPYALCYVVASPSPQGFEADMERAWVRCEHQLAANGRGLLLHKDDAPPGWATDRKVKSNGRSHVQVKGGGVIPAGGLHALALSICSGVLNGAQVSFSADLTRLLAWARNVMCTKPSRLWSLIQSVPVPTKYAESESDADAKVLHFVQNTSFLVEVGSEAHALKPGNFVTRSNKHRATWDTGFEFTNALCGHVGFKKSDGFNAQLWEKVGEKCRVYLVRCDDDIRRGLVVYGLSANGPSLRRDMGMFLRGAFPIGMDVHLDVDSDGTTIVRGYRIVHLRKISNTLITLYGMPFEGDREVSLRHSGKLLNVLSVSYYHSLGMTAKGLSIANPENWQFPSSV